MIRDPSDGSVREESDIGIPTSKPITGQNPAMTSGLPLESTKAESKEKLEKSRAWLKSYHGTGE